ncbi:McrB family protein [Rathayibacter sp. KR2-224]|uniref:McrB family protein n=1 Tax=Rathayibacter sp. KR2-224 TaxID=3400913 RepID=UPI003C0DF653
MELAVETIRVLRRFKNAVLEGPPGTGKSHVVTSVAEQWEDETGRRLLGNGQGNYAITLHPNTTYEEFVEGLRYDDVREQFVRRDGFLRVVISEALDHPEGDFLVLIDELNRANVPKVFGDLLLCMESTKRSTFDGASWVDGMEVTLPYSGSIFSVPSNVYLLGTMNTSDRSIAPLDSALRRRFGFIRVEPLVGSALRASIEAVEGADAAARIDGSISALSNLNEALRQCLGPNAMLGHSYLFGVTPTVGAVAAPSDPIAQLRVDAADPSVTEAYWLEVGGMWGGNHNQLDLPDVTKSRRGLVDEFFPMTSGGVTKSQRSSSGIQDRLDISYDGETYAGNTIEYNSGGNNFRLKYQGRTAAGDGLTDDLQQQVHVWLRLSNNTFELFTLDRTRAVIDALRAVSVNPGWHEHTGGPKGRAYGVIDLPMLTAVTPAPAPSPDDDAEWMVWRYAILPQLIDTVTQAGATDLLDPALRRSWLEAAAHVEVEDRWAKFDGFLVDLSLAIREEGYGLTRGLVVVDIPAGAKSGYLPDDDESADDTATDGESDD